MKANKRKLTEQKKEKSPQRYTLHYKGTSHCEATIFFSYKMLSLTEQVNLPLITPQSADD